MRSVRCVGMYTRSYSLAVGFSMGDDSWGAFIGAGNGIKFSLR